MTSCESRKVKYSGLNDLVIGVQQIVLYENGEFYFELGAGGAKGNYQIQNDTVILEYKNKPQDFPDKILMTENFFQTIENEEYKKIVKIKRTDSQTRSYIQNTDSFECNEFWISKSADWQVAFDDIKHCSSPLILKSSDSVYGVLFPGSLTLQNDTISVNREAGFPNTCVKIGKIKIGEIVKIDYPHKNIEFKIINDTIIEFDKQQYKRTKRTVLCGCCCDWIE